MGLSRVISKSRQPASRWLFVFLLIVSWNLFGDLAQSVSTHSHVELWYSAVMIAIYIPCLLLYAMRLAWERSLSLLWTVPIAALYVAEVLLAARGDEGPVRLLALIAIVAQTASCDHETKTGNGRPSVGAGAGREFMTRVAIIAAFPGELKPLVRNWPNSTRDGTRFWAQRTEEEEWIAACAGAGQSAATRAFAGIENGGPIDLVFSIGWAGALRAEIAPGTAHNVAGVIDVRTGERFNCDAGAGKLWLATSPKVAPYTEKRRLTSAYNAALVDMEAAAVARLAAMRGIPFYCIKGVSDALTDRLPDFNRFLSPAGQFQLARFTLFGMLRPWYWPSLIRMGENSKKASQSIAESLLGFLDERGHIEE